MYRKPPVVTKENGEFRRVGFEIEFGNLGSFEVAEIIAGLYGGNLEVQNRYYLNLNNTSKGKFIIKIDTSFLYEKKYNKIFRKLGISPEKLVEHQDMMNKLENILEDAFSVLMPYEVATPPVIFDEIDSFDPLIAALRNNKATGTSDAPVNAYATHINIDLPCFSLNTILEYLKAFLLLYPYLLDAMQIELSRRLTSFINPFPDKYVNRILHNSYNPGLKEFIDEFHEYNADRNRPLDLYPALACLDPEIQSLEKTGNVNPRPSLHFRLPDCRIDDPQWSLAREWNFWWYVEYLAANPSSLQQLIGEYRDMRSSVWFGLERKWKNRMYDWIKNIDS